MGQPAKPEWRHHFLTLVLHCSWSAQGLLAQLSEQYHLPFRWYWRHSCFGEDHAESGHKTRQKRSSSILKVIAKKYRSWLNRNPLSFRELTSERCGWLAGLPDGLECFTVELLSSTTLTFLGTEYLKYVWNSWYVSLNML